MTATGALACPVCGGPNGCGAATDSAAPRAEGCWCRNARFAPGLREVLAAAGAGDRCLCAGCAAGLVPSPCLRMCHLDQASGLCTGCGRTLDQIGRWGLMAPAERAAVLLRLRGA